MSWKVRLNAGTGERHLMPSTAQGPQDLWVKTASCRKTSYIHFNIKITGKELWNMLKYQKSLAHKTGAKEKSLLIAYVG